MRIYDLFLNAKAIYLQSLNFNASNIQEAIDELKVLIDNNQSNNSDNNNGNTNNNGNGSTSSGNYGNKVMFAGGFNGSRLSSIDYLTISPKSTATAYGSLSNDRVYHAGTSNGLNGRCVWAGGYSSSGTQQRIEYKSIDSSGSTSFFGNLTTARNFLTACSNYTNDRGLFLGGDSASSVMEYITISNLGNASNFGNLAQDTKGGAATSNGTHNRGIIAGGENIAGIYYFDISSTGNATVFGDMIASIGHLGAVSNGENEKGLLAGGFEGSNTTATTTQQTITINSLGNAQSIGNLTVARADMGSASNGIGNVGVFGGGRTSGYTVLSSIDFVNVSAGGSESSGDYVLTTKRGFTSAASND